MNCRVGGSNDLHTMLIVNGEGLMTYSRTSDGMKTWYGNTRKDLVAAPIVPGLWRSVRWKPRERFLDLVTNIYMTPSAGMSAQPHGLVGWLPQENGDSASRDVHRDIRC